MPTENGSVPPALRGRQQKGSTMTALTMKSADLHRVLLAGSRAVGTDDTLPTLCTVHVVAAEGRVYAESSDRFWLIRAAAAIDDAVEWDLRWNSSAVKPLIAALKTSRRDSGERTVTLSRADGADRTTVSISGGAAPATELILLDSDPGEFPDLDRLMRSCNTAEDGSLRHRPGGEAASTTLNPNYLAKLKGLGAEVSLTTCGEGKATLFTARTAGWGPVDVAGLIMSIRTPDGDSSFDMGAVFPDVPAGEVVAAA